jgi:hypothetical protein
MIAGDGFGGWKQVGCLAQAVNLLPALPNANYNKDNLYQVSFRSMRMQE